MARAALAFADITQDTLERETGISKSTWGRVTNGKRGLKPEERPVVAELCGLQPNFFDYDLSQLGADDGALPAVIRRIETRLGEVEVQLAARAMEEREQHGAADQTTKRLQRRRLP